MRILTGDAPSSPPFEFEFIPLSVVSFGSTVIAEGCDSSGSISWVHAWTVTHGIITQVREYFNTSLTVTKIGNSSGGAVGQKTSAAEISPVHCPYVWESQLSGRAGKSVPGLVLAI
ncbi:PREDICTED: wound-induced protein 1 [Tarenaya hassleriana]|uniref:wound-induced protein 1 n=1 Tax=Tarenaya hassleriana TaxID=28532 RepID=UPI00053C8833|nr:PREDICTED: wound-induced protein 1 [Tarenaya hassleriana]